MNKDFDSWNRLDVGTVDGKEAKAILSQIRVIDTKRLVNKAGVLNKKMFDEIRKAVRNLI